MNGAEQDMHEFYGEIVGADWLRDGTGVVVANADKKFGGFMEFERRGYGQVKGLSFINKQFIEEQGGHYRDPGPDEWIHDRNRFDDPRCIDPAKEGRAGRWWADDFDDLSYD